MDAIIERIEINHQDEIDSIRSRCMDKLLEAAGNHQLRLQLLEAGKRGSTTKFEAVLAELEDQYHEEVFEIEQFFSAESAMAEAEFRRRLEQLEHATITGDELFQYSSVNWIKEGF